jgi:hypothetical protein
MRHKVFVEFYGESGCSLAGRPARQEKAVCATMCHNTQRYASIGLFYAPVRRQLTNIFLLLNTVSAFENCFYRKARSNSFLDIIPLIPQIA